MQYDRTWAQRELDNYKAGSTKNENLLASYENKLKGSRRVPSKPQEEVLKKLQDVDVTTADRASQRQGQGQAKLVADLPQRAVYECDVYAPTDGTILRLFATPGETLASQPRQPATPVLSEFAAYGPWGNPAGMG